MLFKKHKPHVLQNSGSFIVLQKRKFRVYNIHT